MPAGGPILLDPDRPPVNNGKAFSSKPGNLSHRLPRIAYRLPYADRIRDSDGPFSFFFSCQRDYVFDRGRQGLLLRVCARLEFRQPRLSISRSHSTIRCW